MAANTKRTAEDLQMVLKMGLAQLAQLERERDLLLAKEEALVGAIQGLEGGLVATRALLSASCTQQCAAPSALARVYRRGSPAPSTASAASALRGVCRPHVDSPDTEDSAASTPAGRRSAAAGPAASLCSDAAAAAAAAVPGWRDPAALLARLDAQEDRVQQLLQQLGERHPGSLSGTQQCTTQLLQRASADPARVRRYLALTLQERSHFMSQAGMRLGLLLAKASSDAVPPGSASVEQQLADVVDELAEQLVVCGLWQPPAQYLAQLMFNLDTQLPQAYPDGWWRRVAQAIDLTPEQKAVLRLTWSRVKASATQLTAELDALQREQQLQHQQRLHSNRRFEAAMRQVPQVLRAQEASSVRLLRLQQLQLRSHKHWQQQHRQQEQQQQQEAAHSLLARLSQLSQLQRAGQPAPAPAGQQQQQQQQAQPRLQGHQHSLPADVLEQQLMEMWRLEVERGTTTAAAPPSAAPPSAAQAAAAPGNIAEDLTTLLLQLGSELLEAKATNKQLEARLQQQQQLEQQAPRPGDSGAGATLPQAPAPPASVLDRLLRDASATAAGDGLAAVAAMRDGAARAERLLGAADAADPARPPGCGTGGRGCCGEPLDETQEVLLQSGGLQERQAERRMQLLTDQFRALYLSQAVQYVNVLSKPQLAALCVHAHPFVADFVALSEAFEEGRWC